MNTKHIIVSIASIIASLAFLASPVHADMCTTDYGGNQTCKPSDLTINKQVKNASTSAYVDNLTTSDPTFAPGSEIDYRLIIKNSSGETFNPVNVKDTLPPYVVSFISGQPGTFNFDTTNHVLTFQLANLIAGETRTFDLRFRIADASQFPAGKSLFCVTNVAEVHALNRGDSDSAQACLQNGTFTGVTTLPVAGFNDFALLLPFAGVALSGFALLKGKKRG
jgi:uncharacterized repeat protein (TIGR01451 family)